MFPGVALLDHMATLFLVFKGASIVATPVYIPINSMEGEPSDGFCSHLERNEVPSKALYDLAPCALSDLLSHFLTSLQPYWPCYSSCIPSNPLPGVYTSVSTTLSQGATWFF